MPDPIPVPLPGPLHGRRVLVVEDNYMLADDLREELESQGAEVIGPVASVADALVRLRDELAPCMAILDVNLGGELVYPLADVLRAREIPFILTTGYEAWSIPDIYKDVPRAEKPIDVKEIAKELAGCRKLEG